jgi:transposase-like protein
MKSHEAIKAAIEQVGAKQIASDLGVSLSLLYKWSEPADESGTQNPVDRTAQLIKATKNSVLLEWLCGQSSGVFVKNPTRTDQKVDVLGETQRILKEFSDVLQAVSSAWQDHRVSPTEATLIRKEWDELKSIAETFVLTCEDDSRRARR